MPFTELFIYQVKPQKVEEFETLMFEAKSFMTVIGNLSKSA